MSRKPNLVVYGQSLSDSTQWKRVGAAWTNEKKNKDGTKTKYIRVVLDFMPTTNKLTIWPEVLDPDERKEDEQPT